jgi:DNA-directed RNA polymerase specialized sigma24 family protein
MKLLRYARFDGERSAAQFRSFVRMVAKGVLADWRYSLARKHEMGLPDAPEFLVDPQPSPEQDQISRNVWEHLLSRLDTTDRTVAELFLADGATPREIAVATDRDVHEVYESVARVKRAARHLLNQIGGAKRR